MTARGVVLALLVSIVTAIPVEKEPKVDQQFPALTGQQALSSENGQPTPAVNPAQPIPDANPTESKPPGNPTMPANPAQTGFIPAPADQSPSANLPTAPFNPTSEQNGLPFIPIIGYLSAAGDVQELHPILGYIPVEAQTPEGQVEPINERKKRTLFLGSGLYGSSYLGGGYGYGYGNGGLYGGLYNGGLYNGGYNGYSNGLFGGIGGAYGNPYFNYGTYRPFGIGGLYG